MNRTSLYKAVISGTVITAIACLSIAALARPPYVGVVKKVYPKATIMCTTCHDPAPPTIGTKYGKAVKEMLGKAKDKKTLTVAEIKSLDKKKIKPQGVK